MVLKFNSQTPFCVNSKFTLCKLFSACLLGLLLTACGGSDSVEEVVDENQTEVPADTPAENTGSTDTTPATGPLSDACLSAEQSAQTTDSGIEYIVTPDACFENLAGYDFEANYVDINGLRMHYVDEGPADGELV